MASESGCSCSVETVAVIDANNNLGMNLYQLLAKEGKNTFFSPFSLSAALTMFFCGSEKETSKEIRLAIGYQLGNITEDNIKSAFQQLLSTLEKTPDNYVLNYANSVLSQKGFAVKEEYKWVLQEFFRALILEVDFVIESEKVISHINDWVKNKTNHMIPKLVDSLDPSTVMVILNAVYFKGTWSHKFNEMLTYRQNFYNKGMEDNMKLVDMMHITESFLYSERESFKALQLPYKGDEIAMLILLPKSRNGLKELEKQLSADFFKDLKREMLLKEVDVALPKFRLEYSKSMKETFQELGIRRLFECGAELNRISDAPDLMVSQIIHKAVIVVNEEGTEAAAATLVNVVGFSLTFNPEFIVDHPFAFVIYDTKCDLILFMGKVEELPIESIFTSENDAMAVAQANNHLSVNLYRVLSKEDGNVFFSPFSLSTTLAMLFCGSKSNTSEEMREVLGYELANIPDENIKSSFQQLLSLLQKTPDNYILSYANSLLSQKDFNVKEEYKTILEESFKALLMEVDFVHESQKVVSQINDWVKDKTNNMIPQLLDSLDPATVLVILNAVYFKGNWLNKFNEKATFLQYFYNKGIEDNAVQVDMMHLKESFPYFENESYKAVQLPYKGEEIAMLILLPNSRNGLEEVENKLSSNFIQDFKQNMRKTKIELALPKFRLEYSKSMKNAFQELGMKRVFECGADLSGINDSKQLSVSEIIHKAVVVVNEEGSEAAAATAVCVMLCSLSFDPEVIVDHPFAFVIYDTRSDLILFMGRIEELEEVVYK
ncbi:uncharacterized protein LOC118195672 [Stegodyphus dumicola]|uniref:uncharacterized protein LOC118195672 n=1 Tax=Stegodyphus dumicola TaxID=202533 RepID=UPI0015A950E9|nr:uncharacterized protein LOC118195672 [Stegodyphus dumicola]